MFESICFEDGHWWQWETAGSMDLFSPTRHMCAWCNLRDILHEHDKPTHKLAFCDQTIWVSHERCMRRWQRALRTPNL